MPKKLRALLPLVPLVLLGACEEEAGGAATAPLASPALTVTVIASGRPAAGEMPRIMLMADDEPVGEAEVTASRAGGEWGSYAFTLRGQPPRTLAVRYVNDAGERDVWIRRVLLDETVLDPGQARYLRDGREPLPGRSRMSWAGELRFQL